MNTSLNSNSVVLSLNGLLAHHKYLAESLAQLRLLRRAVLFGNCLEVFEAGSSGQLRLRRRFSSYRFCNRVISGLSRRAPAFMRGPWPSLALSFFVERAISATIPSCAVFHGMMGVCLSGLRRAKDFNAVTLVDTATLHPLAFNREVLAACERSGVRPRNCEHFMPRILLDRLEREYEGCDKIVVYSAASQRTFASFSYARKTQVLHPGIDHCLFTPRAGPRRDAIFRVCYVGRIEAAKGLDYLIEAWDRLALYNAELLLIGRVFPEIAEMLAKSSVSTIQVAGILSREEVARQYAQSDLFVFPSVNEGLSLALLEAMSSGLPAIACRNTGADDCILSGTNGLLLSGSSVDGLADAIQWSYEHRDESAEMGRRARNTIEERFTLEHYVERLIGLYERSSG